MEAKSIMTVTTSLLVVGFFSACSLSKKTSDDGCGDSCQVEQPVDKKVSGEEKDKKDEAELTDKQEETVEGETEDKSDADVKVPDTEEAEKVEPIKITITPENNELHLKPINAELQLNKEHVNGSIYYTVDGTEPTNTSAVYQGPIYLEESTTIKYRVVSDKQELTGEVSYRIDYVRTHLLFGI